MKLTGKVCNNWPCDSSESTQDSFVGLLINEELKSLLMKVKEESEKVHLQLIIQKTKITASGPITSCQIGGETVETVTDFILGGTQNHYRW